MISYIIHKIQKLIKINITVKRDCKEKIKHSTNIYSVSYIEQNKAIHIRNIKERVADLIIENEKYFIAEITRTTIDTILYDRYYDMQRLKMLGYSHRIAIEVFEKLGIFLYATDLSSYIYAPVDVRCELYKLIEEYGLEKVTEEIALYLKENHSDKFGINIICST